MKKLLFVILFFIAVPSYGFDNNVEDYKLKYLETQLENATLKSYIKGMQLEAKIQGQHLDSYQKDMIKRDTEDARKALEEYRERLNMDTSE